jgi:hypothetical protein
MTVSTADTTEWRDMPLHPDLERDLDYELLELEVISSTCGSRECCIVMPDEEDMIRDATYMVVEPDLVTDPIEMI